MRMKKVSNTRFSYKLDKLFWWFFSLAPLFGYLLFYFSMVPTTPPSETVSFYSYMLGYWGLGFVSSNPVVDVLFRVFGPQGVFPVFAGSLAGILQYLAYLCFVEIFHVLFDVMVFIPRLAHKWISKAVQDD